MLIRLQRQLSVALEDRPGRLAGISRLIADKGINIEGVCVIDTVEMGMVRLMTDDPTFARHALEAGGCQVVEAEVITLELNDQLGQLAVVTEALATAEINVEYAYATVDHAGARTRLVMKTSRPRKAQEVLSALVAV